MIDLYRFFLNPFEDEGISVDELSRYANAHLAAMTSNNPAGQLDLFITATDTLLTGLGSSVSSEQVKLGIQLARTQAKEDFRGSLAGEISKIQGAAQAKYGRKGAKMKELFPGGADAFQEATDAEVGGLLDALKVAVGAHVDELGADQKTRAEGLVTS